MSMLENLTRYAKPYIPLFVEGAVFTGSSTLSVFLRSILYKTDYLDPKPAAISASTAWIIFVATQKLAEIAIKKFAEEHGARSKYFTLPLSAVLGFSVANFVLQKFVHTPDSTKGKVWPKKDISIIKMEELFKALSLGVVCTSVFKRWAYK